MRVLHVTNYDSLGGAGIAAYRLHSALRKAGVDSRMLVRTKGSDDPFVDEVGLSCIALATREDQESGIGSPKAYGLMTNALNRRWAVRARGWLGARLVKALGMEGCSLSIFPTGLHKILNASDADVIHLHWINNEMISIKEIAKITKPIVWTLHDCWPLCGTEHYFATSHWVLDSGLKKFRQMGGDQCLAPSAKLFRAVDRYIFRLKERAWKQLHVSFIAPSRWMAEQVRKSELFADASVTVIPNGLDTEVFQPLEQSECRKKWNLPQDKKLILFGAYDPRDPRKGSDLLEEALHQLPEEERAGLGVVVFGSDGEQKIAGLETFWLGKISNDWNLAEVYSAADLFACPSRADNLPTTIAEALACGIPSVGFDVGGIPDMIEHEQTGYLARPYNTDDFAAGIRWALLQKSDVRSQRSELCRRKAEGMFSEEVVSKKHMTVYKAPIPNRTGNRFRCPG